MNRICITLITLLLAACGAADRGYVVDSSGSSSSSNGIGKITHITVGGDAPAVSFNTCYPTSLYIPNGGAAVAQLFANMAACPSTSHAGIVKIKNGGYLPATQRICVVPVALSVPGQEVCTTITDEENIQFSVSKPTSVFIMRDVDLAAFKAGSLPPYATATYPFPISAQ